MEKNTPELLTQVSGSNYAQFVKELSSPLIEILAEPRNKVLYHYTSASGLQGIVGSGNLYATQVLYLNDSSEFVYGKKLIYELLRQKQKQFQSGFRQLFFDRMAQVVDAFDSSLNVYAACFCETADLLSQWRGYGSLGGGYSIGLKIDGQNNFGSLIENWPLHLAKVIYDRDYQRHFLQKFIDQTSDLIERTDEGDSLKMGTLIAYFAIDLSLIAALFKDPAFQEEQEWRMIRISYGNQDAGLIKFRASGAGIVPYIELPLSWCSAEGEKSWLASIKHGPTLNPNLTKRSLELLVREHGYLSVEIGGSNIPFRVA